jgi:predicted RNA-binding Zn-ribbon protein involved in translation (DUF1610 family)
MTNVACFCGCLYSFDGSEGPCPRCGAVAVIRTTASQKASENRDQNEPDAATAGASLPARTPVPSGR